MIKLTPARNVKNNGTGTKMKFYRPLRQFKAISFDLDDTLYNNHPIIEKAEQNFIVYLKTTYPALSELDARKWGLYKDLLVKENPTLLHDVSQWRKEVTIRVMSIYGIPMVDAIKYATTALEHFLMLRSDFTVPTKSIELLEQLAKHYPLIAITNGNVDVNRIGLQDRFQFVLKAGKKLKSKPHKDLFEQAAQQLEIRVNDILHVGDHLITDVYGAQNNHAQAVWFNPNSTTLDGAKLLPSLEISTLDSLLKLV